MDAVILVLALIAALWASLQAFQMSSRSLFFSLQSSAILRQECSIRGEGVKKRIRETNEVRYKSSKPISVWRDLFVADIIQQSQDTKSFVFLDPSGERLPSFLPGQHLLVEARSEHAGTIRRCYSLSHGPGTGFFRITVKRREGGTPETSMSARLHDWVKVGDILHVKGPQGHFTTELAPEGPVVLLAAGIGITPMLSMLEGLLLERPTTSVWLFYQVRDCQHEAFGKRLRELAMKYTQFKLFIFQSRPLATTKKAGGVFEGKLTVEDIQSEIGAIRPHFFMCGPDAWMKSWVETLCETGHSLNHIHFESFGEGIVAPNVPSEKTSITPQKFKLSFQRTRAEIQIGNDENLLDAAIRSGAAVESGCRSGNCGACVTKVLAGKVRYRKEPQCEVSNNQIALCLAQADSDLLLDA